MFQQGQSNESVPYWAMRRAIDRSRLVLREAIHRALRNRQRATVLDIGSGGGLLAAWAAEVLTDGTVLAVEDDEDLWSATTTALRGHRNRHRITIVRVSSLLEWTPPEPWDLLLCDVLSSGLITQPQVALVNHFLPFGSRHSEVLPVGVAHAVELLGLNLQRLPVELPRTCFQDDTAVSDGSEMSPLARAGRVYFDKPIGDDFRISTEVVAHADGPIDAIRLSTTLLTEADVNATGSVRVAAPIVIPLPRVLTVSQGQRLWVRGLLNHRIADKNGRATGTVAPWALQMNVEL